MYTSKIISVRVIYAVTGGASHFFIHLIFVFCQVRKNLGKKVVLAMSIITKLHKWDAPLQDIFCLKSVELLSMLNVTNSTEKGF